MRDRLWTYIYQDNVLCRTNVMKIIGDTYEGHTVWQVDYCNRIIYLTD